jgi:hypothetical protein
MMKHSRRHAYIYHFEIHAKAADIDHAVSVSVPARLLIGRTFVIVWSSGEMCIVGCLYKHVKRADARCASLSDALAV